MKQLVKLYSFIENIINNLAVFVKIWYNEIKQLMNGV